MIYAYIRVSTEKQTLENQRFEIANYAKCANITIDKFVEEKMSGTVAIGHRELGKLQKKLKKGDMLLVPELSRLGRSLLNVMAFLNFCMERGINIYSIKERFELGDNIQSKVIAFAFSLSAEIERQLISQRTKEALARLKASGVKLGCPYGKRKRMNQKCESEKDYILEEYHKGTPIPTIAKNIGIARGTLYRYMYYAGIREPIKSSNGRYERGLY